MLLNSCVYGLQTIFAFGNKYAVFVSVTILAQDTDTPCFVFVKKHIF